MFCHAIFSVNVKWIIEKEREIKTRTTEIENETKIKSIHVKFS